MTISRLFGAYLGAVLGGAIGNFMGYFASSFELLALSFGIGAFSGILLADFAVNASLAKGIEGMFLGLRKGFSASAGGIVGVILGGVQGMLIGPLVGLLAGELVAKLLS